jgi:dTDP-4-amino-4,6-dideoxygalactose transaminase
MNIPFNNFTREYQSIKSEIDQAVSRVLESGWFILGKEGEAVEKEMAAYIGAKYCVGVANGTDAITIALLSQGIGAGDEVITTNMSAYPTVTGIEQTGAKAVVVDIDDQTGLIDPVEIEKHITPKTKAVVPVHIYGQAADLGKILEIAKQHNLIVMEDCAQAFGAEYQGKKVGTFGAVSSFSFYPTKNLGAYGDGGAVMTNDEATYKKLLRLRNYGQSFRYYHDEKGINSRLDEMQAAILRVKLHHLDAYIARRREIAEYYNTHLQGVTYVPEVQGNMHTFHLYVIQVPDREKFMAYLAEKGVGTIIHYPVPMNEQKAFVGQKGENFPNTVKFTDQIVSLPMYPELTQEEIEYIVQIVNLSAQVRTP